MTVATNRLLERVEAGGETLAVIVRADYSPTVTEFVTGPDVVQQLGFVVYPAGSEIPRHDHRALERTIEGTPECLLVRKGRAEVTLYDRRRREVCRRVLECGDVILLAGGGHGFRQLEDTVFMEIKQGPYAGVADKESF